jgi:hypothetical protein
VCSMTERPTPRTREELLAFLDESKRKAAEFDAWLADFDIRCAETDRQFAELKRASEAVIKRSQEVRRQLDAGVYDEGPWLPLDRWTSPRWWISRLRGWW